MVVLYIKTGAIGSLGAIYCDGLLHGAKRMSHKDVPVRAFVPENVRNAFKAECAKNGQSQAEVLRKFIELYSKGEIKL